LNHEKQVSFRLERVIRLVYLESDHTKEETPHQCREKLIVQLLKNTI
jgi:hypothetical protein